MVPQRVLGQSVQFPRLDVSFKLTVPNLSIESGEPLAQLRQFLLRKLFDWPSMISSLLMSNLGLQSISKPAHKAAGRQDSFRVPGMLELAHDFEVAAGPAPHIDTGLHLR